MEALSRKRISPPDEDDARTSKRLRTRSSPLGGPAVDGGLSEIQDAAPGESHIPTVDEQARGELRRSIVLALQHVGFESASCDTLESFTMLVESYMESLVCDVQILAHASRRTLPSPRDFDAALARFNLTLRGLRPQCRNPIAKHRLQACYFDPLAEAPAQIPDLPLIGEQLSGRSEKESKPYIPKGFPVFPSIHTYRYTPEDVDIVTVRGSGLRYENGTEVGRDGRTLPEGPRGDPKKIREAAAIEAKQAEEALRGLVRASKINALKELRSGAERNQQSRERYKLWETAMREMMDGSGTSRGANGTGLGPGREEIADHSMMVNAQRAFHQRELQRAGKKAAHKA